MFKVKTVGKRNNSAHCLMSSLKITLLWNLLNLCLGEGNYFMIFKIYEYGMSKSVHLL